MTSSLHFEKFLGTQILNYVPIIAQLRTEIFRDFPYLYNNSLDHEERYLNLYTRAPDFFLVLAFDGEEVVGASTGVPLEHVFKTATMQQLLQAQGYTPQSLFYLSESVLKKTYRGQGIGVRFFEERENYAKSLGRFDYTCFYAVQRPLDHPKRPPDYVPLDSFWQKRGYTKHPELQTNFSWQDQGESEKSSKTMGFWLKRLKNK
jgi:GNAT superfamily N-acetyltransferase